MAAGPRLLLTGFESFAGHAVNPTAWLMERLVGDGVTTAVLPVEFDRSGVRFEALVAEHRPDAVIAFGMAFSSDRILMERVALNLDDAPVPDNAGTIRTGRPIVADGPVGYWSTLPVDRLVDALQGAGFPAGGSGHAGGYVCNHLFFRARHFIETHGLTMPMGFVHVPPLPEQVAGMAERTGLAAERLEAAARLIIDMVRASGPAGVPQWPLSRAAGEGQGSDC